MKFVASQGGPKVPADASGPRRSASDRARPVVLASTSTLRSPFPASRMPRQRLWWKKRTRFAPIPTPPAATSRFGSRWCSGRWPARDTGRATRRFCAGRAAGEIHLDGHRDISLRARKHCWRGRTSLALGTERSFRSD
jgi:hypothetical protein